MNITRTVQIDKPAADVWKVVAEDFDKAADWMRGVVTSYPSTANVDVPEAPISGRVCEFNTETIPFMANEVFTKYDSKNYELGFSVYPENAPKALPLIRNDVVIKVNSLDTGRSEVVWSSSPELKLHGRLLSPVLKPGLGKTFDNLLEDLKYYVETGNVHPAKAKFDEKMGVSHA